MKNLFTTPITLKFYLFLYFCRLILMLFCFISREYFVVIFGIAQRASEFMGIFKVHFHSFNIYYDEKDLSRGLKSSLQERCLEEALIETNSCSLINGRCIGGTCFSSTTKVLVFFPSYMTRKSKQAKTEAFLF
jgi:hypothetical protein